MHWETTSGGVRTAATVKTASIINFLARTSCCAVTRPSLESQTTRTGSSNMIPKGTRNANRKLTYFPSENMGVAMLSPMVTKKFTARKKTNL